MIYPAQNLEYVVLVCRPIEESPIRRIDCCWEGGKAVHNLRWVVQTQDELQTQLDQNKPESVRYANQIWIYIPSALSTSVVWIFSLSAAGK